LPTGDFETPAPYRVGGATSLLAGDFDGDGRTDVLSREPLDAFGRAKLRFHYFDEKGALAASPLFPKLLASPVITDLSGDGRSDVIFSDFRVGALLGQSDRNWVPETFGSYHIPSPTVRMVAVYDGPIEVDSAVLAVTTLNGAPGFYLPDATGMLRERGKLSAPLESLVGEIASGNLIEDPVTSPCRELVSAEKNATSFSVVDVCTRSGPTQAIVWADAAEPFAVQLEPPAPIDAAPLIVDMNSDGHLDVLLGAGGKTYVSYGDGQALSVATPFQVVFEGSDGSAVDIPMPLAVGDFTGDGLVDFVLSTYLLLSFSAPGNSSTTYVPDFGNVASGWTEAKIADMNGNGKPDVVAASKGRLGIDFFNGAGSGHLTSFSIPTDRPVDHLAVGDFDGDLVNDLAFVEPAISSAERDAIMISFGAPSGPPIAPKIVARVSETVQITVYTEASRGNLVISSSEIVAGMPEGVFTLLDGSGDRIPYAPYALTSLTSDGYLYSSGAMGIAVGGFTAPRHGDVLVIAAKALRDNDWQLWLIPALESSNPRATRLAFQLDPRFLAAHDDETGVRIIHLVSASADLDGDGRDEALWAMPADAGQHCGLAIVALAADGTTVVPRGTVVLGEPCSGAQMLPVDADQDGSVDVAILTGAPGAKDRRLLVLWNDGNGHFSSSDVTLVSGADSPQGFTSLSAIPSRPFTFAYVTDSTAVLVSATATARQFGPAHEIVSLVGGSGIVAADVNGDDAVDLVLATSGDLVVLKAALKIP
jgi:hypothetical protein